MPLTVNYLYEPRRMVIQIARAMMEHRFKEVGQFCNRSERTLGLLAPSWTRKLAEWLNGQDIYRRTEKVWRSLLDRKSAKVLPLGIMARMLQDIAALDNRRQP